MLEFNTCILSIKFIGSRNRSYHSRGGDTDKQCGWRKNCGTLGQSGLPGPQHRRPSSGIGRRYYHRRRLYSSGCCWRRNRGMSQESLPVDYCKSCPFICFFLLLFAAHLQTHFRFRCLLIIVSRKKDIFYRKKNKIWNILSAGLRRLLSECKLGRPGRNSRIQSRLLENNKIWVFANVHSGKWLH